MTTARWIPPDKIAPPPLPNDWQRRDWPLAPVTAFVAGAGYGKTLALLELAERAREAGALTVWYAFDEDDADVTTFFPLLVEAVRVHVPPFGDEVLGLLAAGKHEPRRLWARFFEAIAAYNMPALLAFDDMQRPGEAGSGLLRALATQLDRLPPGLTLGLASRPPGPFSLARLQAQGRVHGVGPERLRFNASEEAAFLRARAGGGAGELPPAWARRAAAFEGWPLGLALLTALPPDAAPTGAGPNDELSRYLADELLASQPPARRALLGQLALLESPDAALCAAVFGEPDASAQLASLSDQHVIQRLADGQRYRLPPFLREHLLLELARATSEAQRADWHRRAARYHTERLEPERALPHWVAARDWPSATAAAGAAFRGLNARGGHAAIARGLASFPPEIASSEPILAYWRGMALSRAGRHDEANAALELARRTFVTRDEAAGELKAVVKLAAIALHARDQKRFGVLIMRALALAPSGQPEDLADLHLIRALAADQRGDAALVSECNEAVLAIAGQDDVEVATCKAFALLNLHTAALHRGEWAAAEAHATQAQLLSDAWDFPGVRLFAGFLIANLRLITGDVDAAGAFLRGLPPNWRERFDWHEQGCALTIVGHYHQLKGEWTEAERALAQARATFERAGFAEGIKVPLERQLWLAVQRKQPARALALAEALPPTQAATFYDMALVVPLARARVQAGDAPGALALLAASQPELVRLQAGLLRAQACLAEAAAHVLAGAGAQAKAALAAADLLIEAGDLGFLRQHDAALWQALAGLHPTEAQAPLREDALVLHGFGDFEIARGEMRLEAWPRRKAKLVLAALMLHPRGLTTSDLADLLEGGEQGDAASITVQVNVSALRRVLEPGLSKGGSSRYVLQKRDRYLLNPAQVADCDLWAFEQHLAQAKPLAATQPMVAARHYEAALARYRGDMLAETFFARHFEAEREGYRREAVQALQWLAAHRLALDLPLAAEEALDRASALAPQDEALHLALLAHHAARKQPERVRRVYWDYRKALKAKLGLAPGEEVERAYRAALALAEPPVAARRG